MNKKTAPDAPPDKSAAKPKASLEIPERAAIMACLREAGRPLTRGQLAEAFAIEDPETRQILGRRLRAMARDAELIRNRRGSYGLIDKMDLLKGRVIGHPQGYGFVVPESGGRDLFLSAREMRAVLHGDRVLVREVHVDRQGRREGALVEVLERANRQLVGRYFEESGIGFVAPDNKRLSQDLLIPAEDRNGAGPGQFVVARIVRQPDKRRQPIGRVIQVIGAGVNADMAVEIAVQGYELPHLWPAALQAEVSGLGEARNATADGRRMLQDLPFVTIDGEDARDFDDAVYCERLGKGWRLLVAIADVSHYVRPETALDAEAQRRGTSVYFPGRVIPMLPERLSNDLCSLKPKVDRFSLVCELEIDAAGRARRAAFYRAVIRSAARLSYTEVAALLAGENDPQKYGALLKPLKRLHALYQVLHAARRQQGLIEFASLESRFEFNAEGHIAAIHQAERNDAHRLIEELMLAANVAAGEFLQRHKIPALYRIHDTPAREKLEEVRALLAQLGLALGGGEAPSAKDYATLMAAIQGRADAGMLETVLLKSMPLALYSPVNAGHFGLGFPAYAHFTSPIRRYPDLLAHRAITHIQSGHNATTFAYSAEAVTELAAHCSLTERRAEEAARDAIQRLKCGFMRDRVGERFAGMISSVTAFGLFIMLDECYVEGLVHVSHLPVDYYHYDTITHSLRGERGGKVFRLGQRLNVQVARVDMDERKIDFELIDG